MRILITGGSGFLGRAILLGHPDNDYVVYSPNVFNQQLTREAVLRHAPDTHVEYIIGDVRNQDQVNSAVRGCDAIIHAAAIKYVPEAELNAATCISVNVQGSVNVGRAAEHYGVPTVVGVSTDKACMPVSVYGATKLLMEKLFVNAGMSKITRYHTVRFGNFIGSTGSVIPKLLDMAQRTGRITITDVMMTRYWMTAQEVANVLVNLAKGSIGGLTNGSMLVPDPPAMTVKGIVTVLTEMVSDKLVVEQIGPRPGEKVHETLLCSEESVHAMRHNSLIMGGMYYEWHPAFPPSESFKLTSSNPRLWLEPRTMLQHVKEALQLQGAVYA